MVCKFAALLPLLFAIGAAAQTTDASLFEAAAIKKPSLTDGSSWSMQRSGAISLRNVTVYDLIVTALYKPGWIPPEGGPEWTRSTRVDLVAKAAPGTSMDARRAMFLSLLKDRFAFSYHRETQVRSVYALVTAAGGHKLQIADAGENRGCDSERWKVCAGGRNATTLR